jgi:hypothetical protein
VDNFTDSLDSTFLQPFIDLQRTTCFRNIAWGAEDEVDKIIDSYAEASYEVCAQSSRAQITGSTEGDKAPAEEAMADQDKFLSQAEALQQGISLFRQYASQGVNLVAEDIEKIYGLQNFSEDLFREIFKLTTDINDHPYYCPYFKNGNVVGAVNVTDPEWHHHYEDILSHKETEDDKAKRKKVLQECKKKMATIETSLNEFFISADQQDTNLYPKYSDLTDSERSTVYEKLKSVQEMMPFIQGKVSTCTDSALSDFVDTVDEIISLKFFENFGKDAAKKLREGRKEAAMTMYDNLCSKFIQAQKRSGNTLKNLPYYMEIDGVVYCARPDNTDQTLEEAYQETNNKSINALPLPKGINEIVMENTEAALSDVMSRRLEELGRYKFSVDIVKQRAMYKALYDTGTDGVSTALQSLMNDFIKVIQTTISKDGDDTPITKAIWKTFYKLQSEQNCGSCSVQEGDFRIKKASP